MPTRLLQEEHASRLLRDAAAVDERLGALDGSLDAPRLAAREPRGGWTVGQVLEHLCIAHDSYLVRIRPLVARGEAPRAARDARWRPTFMGGLLIRSLDPRTGHRRLPAPRSYRPPAEPRPAVLPELLRRQGELRMLIAAGARLEWQSVRLRSPISPLIRLNLGDAYTILVVHAQRHLAQVERILDLA